MASTAGSSGPNGVAKPKKVNRQNRQKLDRQIVQCLTRHSDDMINDLWEFSKESPKTMQRNITQLSRFTRDDILREIQAMPPQTTFFMESRGLNAVDFLGVFFKVLSRNPYTKSGKYSKNTDFVSNQKVIAQCYYDALAVLNISPAGSTFSTASVATTASQRTWKSVAPPKSLAGGASRISQASVPAAVPSTTSEPVASYLTRRTTNDRASRMSAKSAPSTQYVPSDYLSSLSAGRAAAEPSMAPPSAVSVRSARTTMSTKSTQSTQSDKSQHMQSSFAAKHSQLQRLNESMKSLRARGGLASIANVGNPNSPGIGPDDSVSCVQQKNANHSTKTTNTAIRSSASIASSRRKEAMSRPPRAGTLTGGSSYRPPTMSVFSTYTSNTLRAQRQQQEQQQQRFIDVPELTTAAREEEDSNGNSYYQQNGSTYSTANNGYEPLHSPVFEGDSQSQSSQSESELTESTGTGSDDFDGRPPSPKSVIQSHLHNNDEYSYTM
jgi:hypothetical protein